MVLTSRPPRPSQNLLKIGLLSPSPHGRGVGVRGIKPRLLEGIGFLGADRVLNCGHPQPIEALAQALEHLPQ